MTTVDGTPNTTEVAVNYAGDLGVFGYYQGAGCNGNPGRIANAAMAPNTSPSITGIPNQTDGYMAAYQAYAGGLNLYGCINGTVINGSTGYNMMANTSPSIAAIESDVNNAVVAYQNADGYLHYMTFSLTNYNNGNGCCSDVKTTALLENSSSPSIAAAQVP